MYGTLKFFLFVPYIDPQCHKLYFIFNCCYLSIICTLDFYWHARSVYIFLKKCHRISTRTSRSGFGSSSSTSLFPCPHPTLQTSCLSLILMTILKREKCSIQSPPGLLSGDLSAQGQLFLSMGPSVVSKEEKTSYALRLLIAQTHNQKFWHSEPLAPWIH